MRTNTLMSIIVTVGLVIGASACDQGSTEVSDVDLAAAALNEQQPQHTWTVSADNTLGAVASVPVDLYWDLRDDTPEDWDRKHLATLEDRLTQVRPNALPVNPLSATPTIKVHLALVLAVTGEELDVVELELIRGELSDTYLEAVVPNGYTGDLKVRVTWLAGPRDGEVWVEGSAEVAGN